MLIDSDKKFFYVIYKIENVFISRKPDIHIFKTEVKLDNKIRQYSYFTDPLKDIKWMIGTQMAYFVAAI